MYYPVRHKVKSSADLMFKIKRTYQAYNFRQFVKAKEAQ